MSSCLRSARPLLRGFDKILADAGVLAAVGREVGLDEGHGAGDGLGEHVGGLGELHGLAISDGGVVVAGHFGGGCFR